MRRFRKHFAIAGLIAGLITSPVSAQDIESSPLAAPDIAIEDIRDSDDLSSDNVQNFTIEEIISAQPENLDEESDEEKMIAYDAVKLRALDKITARTISFTVAVGETVKFGDVYIRPQTCKEPPPIEDPESAAFLQIWEKPSETESKWVFSGWMFASSPGLSAMDHPVYDVWVLDCEETKEENKE